jgi:hypothetical protein
MFLNRSRSVAKKDIKENFFTGETYKYPDVEDAWRCDGCRQLIYNVCLENGHVYPIAGAPLPRYLSADYKKVCGLCVSMHSAVHDNLYFRALSQEAVDSKKVKQKEWEGMG